tara:strand:+ start:193 stop:384 length:192 start_codon:yes stop_codon:yes gene_type:complete
MMETKPDLRLKEVAEITGCNIRTLQALARQGRLPGCYRLGGSWRVRQDALEQIRNGDNISESE